MALEVIGGIASIAQLAGTVYTISKTLYEVGEALSNAPSDIKDLARDLETFSDELHLLSTLLHGKDGRYADQVYRLTAKIIGDCATICTKIDRIIRKLRSGSVLAKIKWLYKEKEIMKLLARLRDLKLSLMGTLSVLSALRADHRHSLSTETRIQVEDTRLKLAGISMKNTTVSSGSKPMVSSSASLLSESSSSTLGTSATSETLVDSPASRMPSTSVDSFHSALSYQNQDSQNSEIQQSLTSTDLSHTLSSSSPLPQFTPSQKTMDPVVRACYQCRKKKRKYDGKLPCKQCITELGSGDGTTTIPQLEMTHGMPPSQSNHLGANNTRLGNYCEYDPLQRNSGPRRDYVELLEQRMEQVEGFLKPEDFNHLHVIRQSVGISNINDKLSLSAEESHQLDASVSKSLRSWRNEMALSAMKHFNMNTMDAEEWAKHLQIPSNLSATAGPTSPAKSSPQTQIKNKPQELEEDRNGADSEENQSPLRNSADLQASMDFACLNTSTSGSDNDILLERDCTDSHLCRGAQKLQHLSNPGILQDSSDLHELNASSKPVWLDDAQHEILNMPDNLSNDESVADNYSSYGIKPEIAPLSKKRKIVQYSDAYYDYSSSNKRNPYSSVAPQRNQNFAAAQKRIWPEMIQQRQKPHSPTQQAQQFQIQQQQHQKMAQISSRRPPRVTDLGIRMDAEHWRNIDACQNMDSPTNMQTGLYEPGIENISPKPQLQQLQTRIQTSQKLHTRDSQPPYPFKTLRGQSEYHRLMDLPADYTDDVSKQAFGSSKKVESNEASIFDSQNEDINKGLGGLWTRGLINVKSFDAIIWSNLQLYLNRERVYTTSEVGSNLYVANLDRAANFHKERIALCRQMVPRAASSIQKITDVLTVMEETIGLGIGAIAWTCLLGAVENLLSLSTIRTVDSQIEIITEMTKISSIIARYTVMENIYAQWKGMSLDKDYEQSLVNLSTHILIYLGTLLPSPTGRNVNAAMEPYFDRIMEADTACRGFTVIVSAENTDIGQKRLSEDLLDESDDTEDSDETIPRVSGEDEVNKMPSPAKRIKA
ncbi:fungal specific transcription factor [Botrytis cinerea]